jgi:hypothetical protein
MRDGLLRAHGQIWGNGITFRPDHAPFGNNSPLWRLVDVRLTVHWRLKWDQGSPRELTFEPEATSGPIARNNSD